MQNCHYCSDFCLPWHESALIIRIHRVNYQGFSEIGKVKLKTNKIICGPIIIIMITIIIIIIIIIIMMMMIIIIIIIIIIISKHCAHF